ncbi:sugar transferase, partial [Campylobacter upsaliensis]|nr:sugar transferase [Campylobacter upsaliensis]
AFVLEHFDEVSLWLNSKEFKEKYEDINHPYPPLLNPDKLNDENYILNYEKIPANLAWEMNLPLPRMYEFVGFFLHTNGEKAFSKFLSMLDIYLFFVWGYEAGVRYQNCFNFLLRKDRKCALVFLDQSMKQADKFAILMSDAPLLCLVRDPIDALKSFLNVRDARSNSVRNFTYPKVNFSHLFESIIYVHNEQAIYNPHSTQNYPALSAIKAFINPNHWMLDYSLNKSKILSHFKKIIFVDMREIQGDECYKTMSRLSNIFKLNYPNDIEVFNK